MLEQTFDKIKNIHSLSELRMSMLFFGLAMWIVTPIMGNIPLLLSIQLDLLKPKTRHKNLLTIDNFLLIIVVISISIYISSIEVFADTQVYLDVYQTLDTKGIFDNVFFKDRYEFVLFLFLYPIHILTNGSEYLCLFLFSLIANSTLTFYISKKLSKKYYPTLLIIVFSTYYYYSQVFYMRQFLSIMLVLMALVSIESSWLLFFFWSFLAIFSHLSSAMYIAVCIASKLAFTVGRNIKVKIEKTDRLILYIVGAIALIILIYLGWTIYSNPQQIYAYANNVINLLPQKDLSNTIQDRVNNYDGRDIDTFMFTIFRAAATTVLGVFIILKRTKKITPELLSLNIFYLIAVLQLGFILVTGFNQRIAYLFLSFYGLFFCIGLDDRTKLKPFGIISVLTMFVAAANTFNFLTIQVTMANIDGWSFLNDNPMSMSVFDYILYFFQSV